MSRKIKLIIYGSIIIISIIFKTKNNRKYSSSTDDKSSETVNSPISNNDSKKDIIYFPTPGNGNSPYDPYFGKGIYNNSTGNVFKIKNSNSTDAVVLLVNANTK